MDDGQLARFGPQMKLFGFGKSGQRRLMESRIAVVGLGGIGCHAAQCLAASGVGTILLIDGDRVEEVNLARQTLYTSEDVGCGKPQVLKQRFACSFPHSHIQVLSFFVDNENAHQALEQADIALDCTDTWESRKLIAETCQQLAIPLVFGSAIRWMGQVTVFSPPETRSFEEVFGNQEMEPVSCAQSGIMGSIAQTIGCLMATEATKLIVNVGQPLKNRILILDGETGNCRVMNLMSCPQSTVVVPAINPAQYLALLEADEPFMLVDVRETFERSISVLPNDLHIPMGELADRMGDLDKNSLIILYCRTGGRSGVATQLLRQRGFLHAYNFSGGINAYARQHDPSLTIY